MSRPRIGITLGLLLLPVLARAQKKEDTESSLAKASQNPVADLASLPLQVNFYSGGGLDGRSMSVANLQPVLPLPIGKKWNFIARTIIPFVNAPVGVLHRTRGIGDILFEGFFTKSKPDDPIWGVGPVLSFPTASTFVAETGDWGLGPAAVVVKDAGPWLLGLLALQVWPIAENDDGARLDQLTIQPFINYNLAHGWAITTGPLITANWAAPDDDDIWTVPLGLGVSKVTALGRQPLSVAMQYYYAVERPSHAGSSQLRLQVSALFPAERAKEGAH